MDPGTTEDEREVLGRSGRKTTSNTIGFFPVSKPLTLSATRKPVSGSNRDYQSGPYLPSADYRTSPNQQNPQPQPQSQSHQSPGAAYAARLSPDQGGDHTVGNIIVRDGGSFNRRNIANAEQIPERDRKFVGDVEIGKYAYSDEQNRGYGPNAFEPNTVSQQNARGTGATAHPWRGNESNHAAYPFSSHGAAREPKGASEDQTTYQSRPRRRDSTSNASSGTYEQKAAEFDPKSVRIIFNSRTNYQPPTDSLVDETSAESNPKRRSPTSSFLSTESDSKSSWPHSTSTDTSGYLITTDRRPSNVGDTSGTTSSFNRLRRSFIGNDSTADVASLTKKEGELPVSTAVVSPLHERHITSDVPVFELVADDKDDYDEAEKSLYLQLFRRGPQKFVVELRYWNLLKDFFQSEFDPPWHLDDMIVLSGDGNFFGSRVLDLVNSLLVISQSRNSGSDAEIMPKADLSAYNTFTRTQWSHTAILLQPVLSLEVPSILVEGSRQAAKAVADILGWIFDSLRLPQIYDKNGHGDKSVVVQTETKTIYCVTARSARDRSLLHSSCWHPLFPEKVVSSGPIPERPANMKGLEIDYQLLIAISGVDIPTIEEGGIYFDGYRSALYPIRKDLPSQSLQWHLKTVEHSLNNNDDESDSSDHDRSRSKAAPSFWYKTHSLSELEGTKRHFVGWCSSAISTLGTRMQDRADLEWSDAKCHKRSTVEMTTNLNLNLAFHGVGATVGKSFKRGRTERNPFENHEENLLSALLNAKKSQVLLRRPSTKQAWLVPKTSVVLQLVQSYMTYLMAEEPSLSLPIHFAEASHDGGQNAYKVLWDHRNEVVPMGNTQNPCYLLNVVRMFLFALEKLSRLSETGEVCGWEMRDLVNPPGFFDLKRQSFRLIQLPWWGGWNRLLPEIRLVLYFEGLNDPIVAEERVTCINCAKVPKGKDLLGITMVSLKHFTQRFRSKYLNGSGRLTESWYWDSPARLFGISNGEVHRCSAIQRITKNDRCNAPEPDELKSGEEGAVIFEPCFLSHEETQLRIL